MLIWDDGATETHEGPLALGVCSRGFELTLDGMDRLARASAGSIRGLGAWEA